MVDCCSMPGLLPFEQALEQMLSVIEPIKDVEEIPLSQASNRILAREVTSPVNVPPNDNSAMDGYAFALASLSNSDTLHMAGRSMAGAPYNGHCQSGECIRIMTGAKIPDGCDTVEMQENCQVVNENDGSDYLIKFLSPRKLSDNVRKMGEDIALGQGVFKPGRSLTTADIGVLASLGVDKVTVYRKLKVAILSTGDELKSPGQILQDGDIYESNGHCLKALLTKLDVEIIDFGIIEDNEEAILSAYTRADTLADAVISSGGVSVGDADYTKSVLESLGSISFWKIAMKPGKPFAFGTLPNSYFFGLPGNPVSALVTAHQLTLPALLKLQNVAYKKPLSVKAKTLNGLNKRAGRLDFQRGMVFNDDKGDLVVSSTGSQGSGILTSMSSANCYIVLPSCQGKVEKGEWVDIQLFDKYLQ